MEVMESVCIGEYGKGLIAILNEKINFKPLCIRETSTDFYDKHGISWNGIVDFHSTSVSSTVDGAWNGPDSTIDRELSCF